MSFHVPANQTVSYSVYLQTIAQTVPHDVIKEQEHRISRAFDMGEPIWMITEEIKQWAAGYSSRHQKTPRQMAIRVVQL